ncbi:MAG: 3-phosphoshikimate 1-carboxyvinyltransferase [bacterium]|nr:3-phosphoshikimate 1-carboxyvinyltransferase [bacterium]
MSRAVITKARSPLRGTTTVPGDKSISHRRALLSLFVDGDVRLAHFNTGADCACTLECLERLGKTVAQRDDEVTISGAAECAPCSLDCGNSGTTARLLMGILAGCEGQWTLTGDDSLSRRPMERVAEPLRRMGARIELTGGRLPAQITGARLRGIEYHSPLPSAQVKSAVLLAALQAEGATRFRESFLTRDHTERILRIARGTDGWIVLDPGSVRVHAASLSARIPGDPSSAAFWIAAALLVPDSAVKVDGVLANPTRVAYIEVLQHAGAQLVMENQSERDNESCADLSVRHGTLRAFTIRNPRAAQCLDEIPALAVLATQASGTSEFRDVGELRVKESNRLDLTARNLRRMGASVEQDGDRIAVTGQGPLRGAEIETAGDHRLAMAFAIAGLAAEGRTVIQNAECVAVSYPEFWSELERVAPGTVRVEP